jgi:hypothetical protein
MYSLRKVVWLVFLVTAGLLAIIILQGVRQYMVAGQYSGVIDENERMLFQFSTIRESVTEALIDRDTQKLEQATPELEKFNSTLSRLQENPLVPAEFKLALVNKIDIAGMVIAIRRIVGTGSFEPESRIVQEDMRTIADHLLKYDRIIVSQARARMVNLQLVIIGSMGLFISIASFSLILLYRNSILPLLYLTKKLQQEEVELEDIRPVSGASREVVGLAEAIRSVGIRSQRVAQDQEATAQADYALLAETVNETTNQLNGIINYAQVLVDSGEDELSADQIELLTKIMETGGAIARSWKKIQ